MLRRLDWKPEEIKSSASVRAQKVRGGMSYIYIYIYVVGISKYIRGWSRSELAIKKCPWYRDRESAKIPAARVTKRLYLYGMMMLLHTQTLRCKDISLFCPCVMCARII